MRNTPEGINSILGHTEEHEQSGRQDNGNQPIRTVKRKTLKKIEQFKEALRWSQVHQCLCYRDPRRERERERSKMTRTENFLNLKEETDFWIKKAQRVQNNMYRKKLTKMS